MTLIVNAWLLLLGLIHDPLVVPAPDSAPQFVEACGYVALGSAPVGDRALIHEGPKLAGTLTIRAYTGPGLAVGFIAAMLGIIGSFFLALFAVIFYPIKRRLNRRRVERGVDDAQVSSDQLGTKGRDRN